MATSSFLGRADAFDILDTRARPKLSIQLAGQDQAVSGCYTTGDRIKGEVIIVADRDIQFENVEITFQGIVALRYLDGINSQPRNIASNR